MRTPILVSGIVLLALVSGGGGYLGGQWLQEQQTATGPAAPLPTPSRSSSPTPSATPSVALIRKTPEPHPVAPLLAGDLQFKTRNFTITGEVAGEVKMSIRPPTGWRFTVAKDKLDEVRFVDPTGERAVRVQSGLNPAESVAQRRQELVASLQSSQPYQNNVQIQFQGESHVKGDDGRLRAVSTLVYTYIPGAYTRYVIVRWVATGDDDLATVSMSVTGLPQDDKALNKILAEATASVQIRD
jgi:hypothetical protein